MEIRFAPGEPLVPSFEAPGKDALKRSPDLIPLLFLLFVFWGGQSSQSFPGGTQTTGVITA